MRQTPRDLAHHYAETVLTWHKESDGLSRENARAVLAALVELGAMTAEEKLEWTTRWDRDSVPPGPAPTDIAARARDLLEREFSRATATSDTEGCERKYRLFETIRTLRAAGVLSHPDYAHWEERLRSAFPREPRPSAPFDARAPRGVVIGPADRRAGLRVTSVEFFDDCVIVRWHLRASARSENPESLHVADLVGDLAEQCGANTLEDDVGTRYTAVRPPWYAYAHEDVLESPTVLSGATPFIPGVPAHAARLFVASRAGGSFEIEYTQPSGA